MVNEAARSTVHGHWGNSERRGADGMKQYITKAGDTEPREELRTGVLRHCSRTL